MSPQTGPARADVSVKSEASYRSPPSSLSDTSQHDVEEGRGRKQDRDRSSTAKAEDESGDDKQVGSNGTNGKPRKRKRSRKGLEKNFACSQLGCGKSYSRAEHLYRHHLNREQEPVLSDRIRLLMLLKMHRKRYMSVITLAASANLYDRIYALDTRRDILLVAHTSNAKTAYYRDLTTRLRRLWALAGIGNHQVQSSSSQKHSD